MAHVSVCIPAHNYGRFLGDAIGSVLAQTYRDFELVVFDNGSSDDTPRLLREYQQRDPAIRCVRSDAPLPIAASFNRALALGTGELVKILCADDWLAPRALEESVAALARHPGAALAATGRLLVGESGSAVGVERYAPTPRLVEGASAIGRCLFGTNYVGEPSAVLFRRRLAGSGFDPRYPHLLDMELWFRLLEQGALACIPDPLAMIRRHGAQATRRNARAGDIVADKTRLYAAYAGKPYVARTPARELAWRLRTAYTHWRGAGATSPVHPALFYPLLPALLVLDGAREVARRWRARRHR